MCINMPVVHEHVTVATFDTETTTGNQQTEITAKTANSLNKVSIAFRLSNRETHTFAKTCYAVCTSKQKKSKAVCIHGPHLEEEGWLVSCAHNTVLPRGPGDSLNTPVCINNPHTIVTDTKAVLG